MSYYEKYIKSFYNILYSYEYLLPIDLKFRITHSDDYGKTINLMLELRAKELISDSLCDLIFRNKHIDEVYKALIEFENIVINNVLETQKREDFFSFCLNTLISDRIKSISCNEALSIIENKNDALSFKNGFITINRELSEILFNLNMKLYIYEIQDDKSDNDDNKISFTECNESDIYEYLNSDLEYNIIPSDYIPVIYIIQIYKSNNFKDFIEYCQLNSISADRNIKNTYNNYVLKVKQTFRFNLYIPYRHIAGDNIYNIIDYNLNDKCSAEFVVRDEHGTKTPDQLRNEALLIYKNSNNINNHYVIEMWNNNNPRYFVYRSDRETSFIEIRGFKERLFTEDEEKDLINKIIKYRDNIKTDNTRNIYISPEFKNAFTAKEYEWAERILKQNLINITSTAEEKASNTQKWDDIMNAVKDKMQKKANKSENDKKAVDNRKGNGILG